MDTFELKQRSKCHIYFVNKRQKQRGFNVSVTLMIGRLRIYKSKKKGKDQESIQPSTTPDPGYQWESDNVQYKVHKCLVLNTHV